MKESRFIKPKYRIMMRSYMSLVAVVIIIIGLFLYIVTYDMDKDYKIKIDKINQQGLATDKDKFVSDGTKKLVVNQALGLQNDLEYAEDSEEEYLDLNAVYYIENR